MRFSADQYNLAIEALRDGRGQLAPDVECCRICHDTGHQAWECGHNPLLAMSLCEDVASSAKELHDALHSIEEAMNDEDQSEAIADWCEAAHDLLHYLAGFDVFMGRRVGPASVVAPGGAP